MCINMFIIFWFTSQTVTLQTYILCFIHNFLCVDSADASHGLMTFVMIIYTALPINQLFGASMIMLCPKGCI